ncbi:uncharacterized protein METZ01_LOCUS408035 [marine metagenome]|uniref:Uncharacterized protein n=1 Tax=marine metagenome TaxID=408172 RepID=A0A382WAJ8_9ZZZZ
MKSYLQGLITGAVLVFAIVVLFGARTEPVGRYAPMSDQHVVDTVTGDIIVATMSESHLATAKKEIVRLRVIMPE